jgi:hypothetical protein
MTHESNRQCPRVDEGAYRGQWLALHPETFAVLAHAKTLREARAAAVAKGITQPLMHSVPESDGYFIGSGRDS